MRADAPIDPRHKILRYPDVLAKVQRGERVWPLNIEIDLSNRCNCRCTWCAFAYMHDGAQMDPTLFERLMDELKGVLSLTFSGGGEPTVHPLFPHLARMAHKAGYRLGLYTNGIATSRIMDAAGCFDWIYVSLDAPDAETYRRIKRVDRYDAVRKTIAALSRIKASGPVVGVGYGLCPENASSLSRFLSMWRDLSETEQPSYLHVHPIIGLDDYASWLPLVQLTTRFEAGPVPVYWPQERFDDVLTHERGEWERGYTVCRGSEIVPCIGADGTLWVCPNTRGKRSLGNLKTESFKALWRKRPTQTVGADCRLACRNHRLNQTLEYVCSKGVHQEFV